MDYKDLLRDLQGNMSQEAFARLLGIRQPSLSRYYTGHLRPGRDVIGAIIRAFPDQRERILETFYGAPDHAPAPCPETRHGGRKL